MISTTAAYLAVSNDLSRQQAATAALLTEVVPVADLQDTAKIVTRYASRHDVSGSAAASNVMLADTSDPTGSILDAADGIGTAIPAGSVLNLFDSSASAGGGVSSALLGLAKLPKGG